VLKGIWCWISTRPVLWIAFLGAPVIRDGILGEPGADAFDVRSDRGSEFKGKTLEFFALSSQ
jgi:hypothetical protein